MFNKNLITNLLMQKGWSRYKLCKEANLAQSTLSDILTGKNTNPRMDTMQKIADALNVSVNDFFEDSIKVLQNNTLININEINSNGGIARFNVNSSMSPGDSLVKFCDVVRYIQSTSTKKINFELDADEIQMLYTKTREYLEMAISEILYTKNPITDNN